MDQHDVAPDAARFAKLLDAVSHELRNPLTPILGMSEMLLDGDIGSIPAGQAMLLRHIYCAAARLSASLDALLDLSRLYTRRRTVEPVTVHVRFCLERVADLMAARPRLNSICVEVDMPDELLECTTDPRLLERTLVELIEWVVRKATPDSRYTLRAEAAPGGLTISLTSDSPSDHAAAFRTELDPLVGATVARELGHILRLEIVGQTAASPELLLRVFVPSEI